MQARFRVALVLTALALTATACEINVTPTPKPSVTPVPTAVPTPLPTAVPTATPQPTASPSASVTPGSFQLAAGCPNDANNLVVNGGFETPDAGGGYNFYDSSFDGWQVTSGSVDVVGTYWQAAVGNQSIDLSGYAPGAIEQAFNTQAGRAHRLTLCLAGNSEGGDPVKQVEVSWNGSRLGTLSFDTTGKSTDKMGWVSYTLILPGSQVSSLSRLTLRSLTAGSYGPAVDNVSVYPQTLLISEASQAAQIQ
ncbi:MAG TPA: DUF642 domain-containing protein [Candidatus Obscuribacterales bacterium]